MNLHLPLLVGGGHFFRVTFVGVLFLTVSVKSDLHLISSGQEWKKMDIMIII